MLMFLLNNSTIVLVVAMMLRILAISPHPKLLSNFLLLFLHWFAMHWYHHSFMTNITTN
jgi:hypothetical protein